MIRLLAASQGSYILSFATVIAFPFNKKTIDSPTPLIFLRVQTLFGL